MYYKINIGVENQPWVLQLFDSLNLPYKPNIHHKFIGFIGSFQIHMKLFVSWVHFFAHGFNASKTHMMHI